MPEYDTAVLQRLPYGQGWPEAPELPTVPPSAAPALFRRTDSAAEGVSLLLMIQHSSERIRGQEEVCVY
ncbi:hypothetical protein CgunFtcFv8_015796 [Champsocephalus gunnari]|uniref:Uncharacterized protein n=1 Tax=Champsocephalus gunnari TaxID=52237 RepID=A0AAN8H3M8_CHAGU|nr:hypothetical protein CgunFtcFv8_015796 [Champsocephalus gunnari]